MSNDIHTWVDGHLAVRARAYETSGFVELEGGPRWPRTTGADVIAIAAIIDDALRRHGSPGILRRWREVLREIEREALAEANETYVGNRSFWSTFEAAAVFLDDIAVPPPASSVWQALIAELGRSSARNVGPKGDGPFKHFDNVPTFSDLYLEQYKYLVELRGSDETDPVPFDQAMFDSSYGIGGVKKKIPRTTNTDVLALAGFWGKQLEEVKEVFGHGGIEKRWKACFADVTKIAMYGNPTAVYSKNNQFWRCLADTAIHVSVADEAPSKWDMAVDSVKDSVRHLPQTIGTAAHKGGEMLEEAAHAVGKIANEAGKGLFSGLGAPVLIGAGLIGLFLISRSRGHKEED